LNLPPGWVLVPPPGGRPQGLLRRDPYERLARRLVSSGAVIKGMADPTAAYLSRVAVADPTALVRAAYIEVPGRHEHTFVTFGVFPGPPDGAELMELAGRRGDSRESERTVEAVRLPWAWGARAYYTRNRSAGGYDPRPIVQYWLRPDGLGRLLMALGDIDAPPEAPLDARISEIDQLTRTMKVVAL
jgi:hypothetical protein